MKNGPYELVVAPDNYPGKLYRDRYCYEHRLVWWKNTGNLPDENEVIHHKNGNKRDNRFENLEKKTNSEHSRRHGKEKGKKMLRIVCPTCKSEFVKPKNESHVVKPTKASYCSRSCVGKASGSEYEEFDQILERFKKYPEESRVS